MMAQTLQKPNQLPRLQKNSVIQSITTVNWVPITRPIRNQYVLNLDTYHHIFFNQKNYKLRRIKIYYNPFR